MCENKKTNLVVISHINALKKKKTLTQRAKNLFGSARQLSLEGTLLIIPRRSINVKALTFHIPRKRYFKTAKTVKYTISWPTIKSLKRKAAYATLAAGKKKTVIRTVSVF